MGRQHRGAAPAQGQCIHMPGKGVYAVGVQHQGPVQVQQPPDQGVASGAAPQAAAHKHRVAGAGPPPNRLLRLRGQPSLPGRQGKRHDLVALGRRHRPHRLRNPQIHQARPGAYRRPACKHRRAGKAHAAADAQHLAEGALVAHGVPPGQTPPDPRSRDLLHAVTSRIFP